jgi:acetyltransferase-like isoleucine patch superfamily enzyme
MAHCSIVQGPVVVGDDVSFGPHAHVTRDVPSNSMVIGAPSRVQRKPEFGVGEGAESN